MFAHPLKRSPYSHVTRELIGEAQPDVWRKKKKKTCIHLCSQVPLLLNISRTFFFVKSAAGNNDYNV